MADTEFTGLEYPLNWLEDASAWVMEKGRNWAFGQDRDLDPKIWSPKRSIYDHPLHQRPTGAVQDSFLLPRSIQEKVLTNSGYQKGTPKDYGPLASQIGDKDYPVWQTAPDAIEGDKLTSLGTIISNDKLMYNANGRSYNPNALTHAGHYPVTYYFDDDQNLYYKAHDLNDYGDSTAGENGFRYKGIKQKLANLLDVIGNPVVVTTGYQPVLNRRAGYTQLKLKDYMNHPELKKYFKDKQLHYNPETNQMEHWADEVVVTPSNNKMQAVPYSELTTEQRESINRPRDYFTGEQTEVDPNFEYMVNTETGEIANRYEYEQWYKDLQNQNTIGFNKSINPKRQ